MGGRCERLAYCRDRQRRRTKRGSRMHQKQADDDRKPDLLVHYRPVAIRAVAAAFTVKRNKPNARPLRETEYSGPAFLDDALWDDEPGVPFIR
ncbi:hypothetical protein RHEC894_PE00450 (plasmid) [Rhizobium sp. CIAT894]|nr:hypothetical protein RHEC894_PE00450 [Rhizobium sp. CIAT894]